MPHRSALTVLLVEDDAPVRRAARRALTGAGYEVLEAASAEEALQLLRTDAHVHVLLTDVGLPGISGPALAAEARVLAPGIPTVLMSGLAREDMDAPEQIRFVPKPFDAALLLQNIHSALVESAGELPTVLVVEDDSRTLLSYQELLWSEGFRMLAAKSVSEAADVFRKNREHIAAVLTDYRLPDGSGTGLVKALRELSPDVPVVFVSGQRADDPELAAACAEPRTEFMAKPVEIRRLAATLRRLIATR